MTTEATTKAATEGARKKAAPKTAAPRKTTRQSAETAAVTPTVVQETAPNVTAPDMRKKELIDEVVALSGVRKKFAKPVVEAMLSVLSDALADGRDLNLAPLGKLKINRTKDVSGGRVIVSRLRQNDETRAKSTEALAEANEDS